MSDSRTEALEKKMPLVQQCLDDNGGYEECAQKILAGDPDIQSLTVAEEQAARKQGGQEAESKIREVIAQDIAAGKERLSAAFQQYTSNPTEENKVAFKNLEAQFEYYQSPNFYQSIRYARFDTIAQERTALARTELIRNNWLNAIAFIKEHTHHKTKQILSPWNVSDSSLSLGAGLAYLAGIGSNNVSSGVATVDAGYLIHLSREVALELGGGALVDLGNTALSRTVGENSYPIPSQMSVGSSYVASDKTVHDYKRDPVSAGPRLTLRYGSYRPTVAMRFFNGTMSETSTQQRTTLEDEKPVTVTTVTGGGRSGTFPIGCIIIPLIGCIIDAATSGTDPTSTSSHQEIQRTFSHRETSSRNEIGSHLGYAIDIAPLAFSWSVVSLDLGLSLTKDPLLSENLLYGVRVGASSNLDALYDYLRWI